MNKGYKGNNGISKKQVIEPIVEEIAKIQSDGLDLISYVEKTELVGRVDKVDSKSLAEDSVIEATKVLINEEKLEYIIKIDNSLSSVELTKSIQQQFDEAYELGYRRVTFPKNTEIEVIDELDGVGDTTLGFREKPMLNLHPSTVYDLNDATIKIKKNNYAGYSIFAMENISNTTLKNGKLIGDKSEHTFVNFTNPLNSSHEFGFGVYIKGAKYCNVENLTLSEFTGDGMYMGMIMCTAKGVRGDGIESGTISTSTGEIEEGEGFRTSSFLKIKQGTVNTSRPFEYKTLFIFPNNPHGFGQNWKYSKKWITIFFYKEDETFIKSERIHISDPVAIPEEADSFKVALPYDAEWSTEDLNERGFCARICELSENTNIKQCVITNCRRNGLSISGSRYCSVTDCKIANIKGTAPQACIDVEDSGLVSQGVVIQNCEFAEGLVGVTFYDGSSHILKDSGFYNIQYPFGSTYSQNCTIKNCVAIINNGKSGHVEFNQTSTPKPLAPVHTVVDNIKLVGVSNVVFKGGVEARNILLEDCARFVADSCKIDNLTIVQKEIDVQIQGYNIQNKAIVENLKATGKFGRMNLRNASINHGDLSLTTETFINIADGVMGEVIVPSISLDNGSVSLSLIKDCIIGTTEDNVIRIQGTTFKNSTFKFEGSKLICGGAKSVYGMIPLFAISRTEIKNCELYNYNQDYAFLTGYGCKGDLVMTDSILVNKRENFNNFKIVSNYFDNNIVLGDNEFINVVQPPIDTKIIDEDNIWGFEE